MSNVSNDLTVIFLTVNKVPKKWAEYQKHVLLKAARGASFITISKEPMDWGLNLIQEEEPSVNNIYRQILRAAKLATTPYIAIAEDDCLYHKDHFIFRPPMDTFAYDGHRWGIHTWGIPTFYWKDRISNAALIAPRELAIETLEERFKNYPRNTIGELGNEKGTQIDRKKTMTYWPYVGMIYFSHVHAMDELEQQKRKGLGIVKAFEIPYWGRAEQLVKKFV